MPRRAGFLALAIGLVVLVTAGFVVAALQLAAGLFLPFVLFPLWVLVASIVLVRRNPSGSAAPAS